MKKLLILCTLSIFGGLLNTSCSSDPGYQEVSYGGTLYYYDVHGYYYRRHPGGGYRPCPKPPGKPDRPPKPTHPIARPPQTKPSRPVVLPGGNMPHSSPGMPSRRPMPGAMPSPSFRSR